MPYIYFAAPHAPAAAGRAKGGEYPGAEIDIRSACMHDIMATVRRCAAGDDEEAALDAAECETAISAARIEDFQSLLHRPSSH